MVLFGIGASCKPSGCGLSVGVFSEFPLSGSALFGIGEFGIGLFGIGLESSDCELGLVRKTSRSVPAGGRMKTWIFVPGTIPVVERLRQSRSPLVAM